MRRLLSGSAPQSLDTAFVPISGQLREFYSGGCGSVIIDTNSRTFSVGHTLSAEAAGQLIEDVCRFMPPLRTRSTAAIARPRTIDYAAGFMTVTMIGFAINLPIRLAITDRPICLYDDRVVPRHTLDVSRMHPGGRVSLVPIGDFPVDRATAIAEHFRTRFGVAIDVAPAIEWPEDAYVEPRQQMDSAMMLTRLESIYPTTPEPVVIIGLPPGICSTRRSTGLTSSAIAAKTAWRSSHRRAWIVDAWASFKPTMTASWLVCERWWARTSASCISASG